MAARQQMGLRLAPGGIEALQKVAADCGVEKQDVVRNILAVVLPDEKIMRRVIAKIEQDQQL